MERIHPIAKVSATTGLKGEVRLRPLSRYCDDYIREKQLSIGISPGTTNALILEDTSGIGKKTRFKFEGINSIEAAEKMIGQTVYASANNDDLINLVDSALLDFKVITDGGDIVGVLKDVMWLPSCDVYVVDDGEREVLIPVVPEVVRKVNYENEYIMITPMDGLLD